MVWGAFSYLKKLLIAWISIKLKSADYVDMLEISILDHAASLTGSDFIFQQDSASIYCSKIINDFLIKEIEILVCPSNSPYMNPIANLWGILVQKICGHGR